MKRAKFTGVFVLACCLLAYLMFVKYHYSSAASGLGTARLPPLPHYQHSDGMPIFQYGVMFDAGSTGTRVHIFKFLMKTREAPELDEEIFKSIKPGLSSYAEDPEKCCAGIIQLLEVAQSSVPSFLWSRTPVVLKATAGLRLLPREKARHLLDTVRALFQESPFMSKEDSVSIMDGNDEGISAWVTVNFLTGGLQGPTSNTVGMLDLGGGSTQITFGPPSKTTVQSSGAFITSFRMFNSTHTVYTHSYLGLGLMSARLNVLGGGDSSAEGSGELVSPCLAPEYSGLFTHGDVVYTVKGQKAGEPVHQACLSKVEKFLYRKVMKMSEVSDVDFYAFSYYYDRAVDLGLIDEQFGGTIRVLDYMDAAQRVCGSLSMSPPHSPFLCLDLVYISVLLQELGFPPHKQFRLARTIDEVETSWALGATFQYIQTLKTP
ncbi:unnamed protein product [Ophioblennius macclurei]